MHVARRSDIVFVGLDEARALWGCTDSAEVRRVLHEPAHLIVKDGAGEAVVFTRGERMVVPALPVEVVEPVGAGDAFAAGWLHAHFGGYDARVSARLGHLMAGVALRSASDVGEPSMPPEEMLRRAVGGEDRSPTSGLPYGVGARVESDDAT